MKIFGDFCHEIGFTYINGRACVVIDDERYRAIQADALREAAEIARTAAHKVGGYQFASDVILTRAKEVENT